MLKGIVPVIVLALLASYAHADSAGNYSSGVEVETAPVLDRLFVRVSDDTGTSGWVEVVPDPSGDRDVLSSGEITAGHTTVKWFPGAHGTLKKKNADGTWTRLGRQKSSKRTGELEGSEMDIRVTLPPHYYGGPGEDITTLPEPKYL